VVGGDKLALGVNQTVPDHTEDEPLEVDVLRVMSGEVEQGLPDGPVISHCLEHKPLVQLLTFQRFDGAGCRDLLAAVSTHMTGSAGSSPGRARGSNGAKCAGATRSNSTRTLCKGLGGVTPR